MSVRMGLIQIDGALGLEGPINNEASKSHDSDPEEMSVSGSSVASDIDILEEHQFAVQLFQALLEKNSCLGLQIEWSLRDCLVLVIVVLFFYLSLMR